MESSNRGKYLVARYAMFTLGLALMALGTVMTIKANLGVAPWEVLHIGLTKTVGLSMGVWSLITGALVLLVSYLAAKVKPALGTILNMISFGIFLDFFLWLDIVPIFVHLISRILLFIAGVIVLAIGIGMYISPRVGAGPRDSFMLAMYERMGWSIQKTRICIEVSVLIVGMMLGGPVSIGTLLIAALTGPMIQRTIPFWEKVMAKHYGKGVPKQAQA